MCFLETEQEVKDEIIAKRKNIRPIDNCLTASEISEEETYEKKPVSKGHTDLIKMKIESLKLKQAVRKSYKNILLKSNAYTNSIV